MSILRHKTFSRRSAIAGALTSLALLRAGNAGASQVERPAPVDLGHGLEIRDYRLFPTTDVMRFIVEIHNTTDQAIDSPAVGLILPHLESKQNFSWANPISMVLHPHSSDCLIGIAPQELTSDEDWQSPIWELCNAVSTESSQKLSSHEIAYSDAMQIIDTQEAHFYINATNLTDSAIQGWLLWQPIIWDQFGRLCGAGPRVGTNGIAPHETATVNSRITPTYAANPFTLIESAGELIASYSIQPGAIRINPRSCDAILPWNS